MTYTLPGILPKTSRPDIELVKKEVTKVFDLKPDAILSKDRYRPLPEARFMGMYILHCFCGMTLRESGFVFGKDHSTCHHAKRFCKDQLPINKEFRLKFIELCKRLEIEGVTINSMINGTEG